MYIKPYYFVFDLQPKAEPAAEVTSANETSVSSIQPHVSALTNAVRIERLSDDEDVDITDDFSDSEFQSEKQPERSVSPDCNHHGELSPSSSDVLLHPPSESTAADEHTDPDINEDAEIHHSGIYPEPVEESGNPFINLDSPSKHSLTGEEETERAGTLTPLIFIFSFLCMIYLFIRFL